MRVGVQVLQEWRAHIMREIGEHNLLKVVETVSL